MVSVLSNGVAVSNSSTRRALLGWVGRESTAGALRAASGVEYGVIVGLVAVLSIVAVQASGERISAIFANAGQQVSDKMAGAVEAVVDVGAGVGAGVSDVAEEILIFLTGGVLPAVDNATALSFDFSTPDFLSVEGVEPTEVSWSEGSIPLPAGLALDPDLGVVSGAVAADGQYSFEIVATAGAEEARAVYTIDVNGVRLAVTDITSGGSHSCAILAVDGSVMCWGLNSTGQLGSGSAGGPTPVAVLGLGANVRAVSAGTFHTCAIDAAGAAKCWGWGRKGQIGDDSASTGIRYSPTQVKNLTSGVKAISAGNEHTCAIDALGAAKCWGIGTAGQIGDNSSSATPRIRPTQVFGLGADVVAISAGSFNTCAIDVSGAAKCWGEGAQGAIGDGSSATGFRLTPTPVLGMTSGVQEISVGGRFVCAIDAASAAFCWGMNLQGQLGDGSTSPQKSPAPVAGLGSSVRHIAVGENHACAVTTAGGVKCWGYNANGQVGVGSGVFSDVLTPTEVSGLSDGARAITGGGRHTCAIDNSGAAKCWGKNTDGQVGDNTNISRDAPVAVFAPSGI